MEIFACSTLDEISALNDSDFALLSLKEFGQRPSTITLDEYLAFVKSHPDLAERIYIEALAPLLQSEIEKAGQFFDQLKDKAAGIYISDDGFLQLAKEKGIVDQIIFCSHTLFVNALDVRFYLKQGIQALCLSPLLSLEQMQNLLDRLDEEERERVEVVLRGKRLLMESKRPFLSNYFSLIENDLFKAKPKAKQSIFYMQEKSRDYPFEIMESEKGSLIYEHEPFDLSLYKTELEKKGLRRFCHYEKEEERKAGRENG